eukprot:PhM_4_TR10462/c0_g1_i1/m.17759
MTSPSPTPDNIEVSATIPKEVRDYAAWLGIDLEVHPDLYVLARDGLHAPLDLPWKSATAPSGDIYFYNTDTGMTSWEHPRDAEFRERARAEVARREENNINVATSKKAKEVGQSPQRKPLSSVKKRNNTNNNNNNGNDDDDDMEYMYDTLTSPSSSQSQRSHNASTPTAAAAARSRSRQQQQQQQSVNNSLNNTPPSP